MNFPISFVTGATGLLGNNLVRLLLAEGHYVRALVRSPEKANTTFADLSPEEAERLAVVEGDLCDVPAFANALDGCTYLFHTAAYFREYYAPGDHWSTLKALNIDATVELLQEANRRGVQRAVHTSSSGVFDRYPDGRPSDEEAPTRTHWDNLYFRSKYLADRAVDRFLETHELPVMTIMPGWMFGPGDLAPTGSGQLVLDFLGRKLPAIPPGGLAVVDARDVAVAMLCAAESGERGRRYLVAGPLWTMERIAGTLAEITGKPAPRLKLPYALVMGVAVLQEFAARFTGKKPLLTRSSVRVLQDRITLTSTRAEQELGVTLRPFRQTLRDVVRYYEERERTPRPEQTHAAFS